VAVIAHRAGWPGGTRRPGRERRDDRGGRRPGAGAARRAARHHGGKAGEKVRLTLRRGQKTVITTLETEALPAPPLMYRQ
jgi:hypothetical protein